jgi:predicted DNA-binding transcriptional regulator YafY
MNRFDRITAILIQLQSKKVVKAQDLATRFGISLRTVYRDIRSLEEAGVPLYGEAGIGYSLVEGYRLPPVMFTQDEALAFITAEKLMGKFSDAVIQQNFASAMYKIKAVLHSTEKDLLENLENQIIVEDKIRDSTSPGNTLNILLKAIADKKVVALTYRAAGNEQDSNRLLEPIGIFHENENWYTIGYCHLRETYRQFRIDRVVALTITDTPQQERSSLQEYRKYKDQIKASLNLQKVVLRITDKTIALYLQDQRHYYGFVSEVVADDYIDMTFVTEYAEGLSRWYMMFADHAEVIEPESFKQRVNDLLEKYLTKNAVMENAADKGLS